MVKFISKLALLLVLFPFVGFFSGVDVQPLAFLLCFFLLIVASSKVRLNSTFILVSLYISVVCCSYFIFYNSYMFLIKEVFFISSFIVIWLLVKNKLLIINEKDVTYALVVYTLVAIIQVFYPEFLSFLVTRSTEQIQMAIDSGRGVRSLTGEPSHLGRMFIIFNLFYFYFYSIEVDNRRSDKEIILISFILLVFSLILARSVYMLAIHIFIIGIFVLLVKPRWLLLIASAFMVLSYITYLFLDESNRISYLLQIFLSEPEFLMNQGAFKRLVNVPIIFNNFSVTGFLGAGDSKEYFPMILNTPIGEYHYFGSARNFGGGFELLLKYGVFSFPLIVFILFSLLCSFKSRFFANKSSALAVSFGVIILFFQSGSISDPLILFLVFIVMYPRGIYEGGVGSL